MLTNYFKIAWRNLWKNGSPGITSIVGLGLGIASCLIVFNVVKFESSFDNFHPKADRTYRVNFRQVHENNIVRSGFNYYPLGAALKAEISGLENVTQMHYDKYYQYEVDNEKFRGAYSFFVDQEFFEVFNVNWIVGKPADLAVIPQGVAITKEMAVRHFGDVEKAIGRRIKYNSYSDFVVAGIVESPPANTDLPFSLLASYEAFQNHYPEWTNNWDQIKTGSVFVVMEEGQHKEHLIAQFESVINKYLKPEDAKNTRFVLMSLNDNHDRNFDFNSFTYDFPVPVMIILSILAGIVLLGGVINYINLSIAQAFSRAREIGIRKTTGGSRFQLIIQRLSETFVETLIALLVATILTVYGMQYFNQEFNYAAFNINPLKDIDTILFLTGLAIVIVLSAGLYPAITLSGYNPINALKGSINLGLDNKGRYKIFSLRKVLIVIQFASSLLLIIVSMVILNQMTYLRAKPLGFNAAHVLMVNLPQHARPSALVDFRSELLKSGEVGSVSYLDLQVLSSKCVLPENPEEVVTAYYRNVDSGFLNTLDIRLLAGRNFDIDNTNEIVINETFYKKLGYSLPSEALGISLVIEDRILKIVGVMEDYYYNGVGQYIGPYYHQNSGLFNFAMIRTTNADELVALGNIRSAWKKSFPAQFFEHRYLEDFIYSFGFFNWLLSFLYIFGGLTIIICCMGLYGLITFMTLRRSKEIGVRKTMGANVLGIMLKLNKQFAYLLFIAYLIAAPLGSWVGKMMLMEFPDRTGQGIDIFVISLLAMALITFISTGHKSLKAAKRNPVEALRYE